MVRKSTTISFTAINVYFGHFPGIKGNSTFNTYLHHHITCIPLQDKIRQLPEMKQVPAYLVLIATIVALHACKVYAPHPIPVTGISHKNDIFISSGLSIPSGANFAAAYSPVEHLNLLAYGAYGPENTYHILGQAGFYWNKPGGTNYEICGGGAQGWGRMMRSDNPGILTGNHRTAYCQFNLTQITALKYPVEYGFGVKTGLMQMDISDNGFYESDGLDPISYVNKYLILEPMAFFRFGKKKIKTGFQLSGTSLINLFENQRQVPYHAVSLSISLNYKFGSR